MPEEQKEEKPAFKPNRAMKRAILKPGRRRKAQREAARRDAQAAIEGQAIRERAARAMLDELARRQANHA